MKFLNKEIGPNEYPFMVGEISCNHGGSKVAAMKLIQEARVSFLDAVKIQIYTADELTINSQEEDFVIKDGIWAGRNLYSLYKNAETNNELAQFMFEQAKKEGIPIFASVFGEKSLAFAESLGCEAYKIASFEVPDYELVAKVGQTGKPVVLSSGTSSYSEVFQARARLPLGNSIILHCVSQYPTPYNEADLSRITEYKKITDLVGFSDHTRGIEVGPFAVALGARMIEKHYQLRGMSTEDAAFSLYPDEMQQFVIRCRRAYEAIKLQQKDFGLQLRRSLYAVRDIKQGENFTRENVRSIRPGYGLKPKYLPKLLKSTASRDIKAGTAMKWEDLNEKQIAD